MSPARVGSTFADTTSATGGENLTWPTFRPCVKRYQG